MPAAEANPHPYILGLTFGFFTFTWILSGMFSMNPIRWPENKVEEKIGNNLVGADWAGPDFGEVRGALTELRQHL
jgi:hypothetical protein